MLIRRFVFKHPNAFAMSHPRRCVDYNASTLTNKLSACHLFLKELNHCIIFYHNIYHLKETYSTYCRILPLGLELAIDPPPPRVNFVHYDFLKLHYIRHKIKDVSPLRVAALTCNTMLYTLPPPPKKKSSKRP